MKLSSQTLLKCMVVGLVFNAFSHGQTAPPTKEAVPSGPAQMSQVSIAPPVIDFGAIKPGSRQQGKFTIANKGASPVKVESAFPSCKCTTISDLAGKVIPPGGEIELLASLDAPRTPGEKDAKVFVAIQGMQQPLIAKMQGVVQLPLLVKPAYIDALKGKLKGEVEISNPLGKPFRVVSCDGASPQFVDFDPEKDPARDKYRLRWDFSFVPEGQFQQWWCVETDVADCPIVPFRIRHESTGIRFDPKADERRWHIPEAIAIAGMILANKPVDLEVEIESTVAKGKPQPVGWDTVRAVKSMNPAYSAELISSKREGDRVRIQFRFAASGSGPRFIYAPVTIQTDTGAGKFFVAAVVTP